jgi:hypothetical protein
LYTNANPNKYTDKYGLDWTYGDLFDQFGTYSDGSGYAGSYQVPQPTWCQLKCTPVEYLMPSVECTALPSGLEALGRSTGGVTAWCVAHAYTNCVKKCEEEKNENKCDDIYFGDRYDPPGDPIPWYDSSDIPMINEETGLPWQFIDR